MERYPVISQIAHLNCVYRAIHVGQRKATHQCLMLCGSYIAKKQLPVLSEPKLQKSKCSSAFGDYTACSCMYCLRLMSKLVWQKKWWGQLLTCLTACYSHVSTTKHNSFQVLSHHPKPPLSHPFWNLPWSDITKSTPTESLVVKGQAQWWYEAI